MKLFNQFWLTTGLSAVVSIGLMSSLAAAITVEDVPNPRVKNGGWVSDRANLISAETEAQLNQQLTELEAQTGDEIAIVTVQDTAGYDSPKAFATELFNYWGVGKAERDNGVLFLVSVGDRRTEIEIGYGLEWLLTKPKLESLLAQEAVPYFRNGQFDTGIEQTSLAIIAALTSDEALAGDPALPALSEETPQNRPFGGIMLLILGGVAIAILFYYCSKSAST